MTIAQDRQDYFWLEANDATTPEMPEPPTFEDSLITPLIDLDDYITKMLAAIGTVGLNSDASQNQGDFIYIAGWWLGLLGGQLTPPGSGFDSTGFQVADSEAFDLDPTPMGRLLIELLKEKSRKGVDVRVLGWISYSVMTDTPHPFLWIFPPAQTAVANSLQANNAGLLSMANVNAQTMNAIKSLRSEPTMAKKCILNTLGHSAGAVHIKGCVIGKKPVAGNTEAIAFTGGLDFESGRWARFGHEPVPTWTLNLGLTPRWHDVQAAIEGPAAQGFYNHFRSMWNEMLARDVKDFRFEGDRLKTYIAGTSNVGERTITASPIAPANPLTHHVQSLSTIPAFNYHWYNCLPQGQAVSYAPNGRFEIRAAWEKAIKSAKRLIYIEDQSYYSREVMEWINAAIVASPNLRVIIVMSGQGDPNDVPDDSSDIFTEVFNKGLLGINPGSGAPSQQLSNSQRNQIRIFKLWGDSVLVPDQLGNPIAAPVATVDTSVANEFRITLTGITNTSGQALPANVIQRQFNFVTDGGAGSWRILGNLPAAVNATITLRLEQRGAAPTVGNPVAFAVTYGIVVHSKTTIVDDKWAMIGSANCMRRSLYTDWEHSVAFLDANSSKGIKDYRKALWAEHFNQARTAGGLAMFDDLDEAIGGWDVGDPAWKTTVATPTIPTRAAIDRGPEYIQPVPLPFNDVPMSDDRRSEFDGYRDPDSRENWGGVCKP